MSNKAIVQIWTDGACKGNPGPGGWGVYMKYKDKKLANREHELFGGELETTNNRMEMMAVIKALEFFKESWPIELYVDSQYVKKGLTEWISGWIKKNWKNSANQPVKNKDLWLQLLEQTNRHQIQWFWVKGHSGDAGNERADQLANKGVEQVLADRHRSS